MTADGPVGPSEGTAQPEEPARRTTASSRDHSRTNQAARDQHFTTYNYYGAQGHGASADRAGPESEPPAPAGRDGWLRGQRTAWIAAGATVAAAIITAGGALIGVALSDNDDSGGDGDRGSASSPSAGKTPHASHPGRTADDKTARTASASAKPPGTKQWAGKLVLDKGNANGYKDLDASQPTPSRDEDTYDFYITGYFRDDLSLSSTKGTVSLWDQGGVPGYRDCAGSVEAAGTDTQKLKPDSVLCVKTSEGRVGRLSVTALPESGISDGKTTFDAIIWALPPGAHSPAP